jgi:predicted  nucleic acid-binding Zn-ribbon protein
MGNELEARERVSKLEAAFADEKAFAATLQTQVANAQRLFEEMEAERDAAKAEIVRLTAERDGYQQEVMKRENELESLRLQVAQAASAQQQ